MPYWIIDTGFKPYVDTAYYYGKTTRNQVVSGGIDTSTFDDYRDGVNLRTTTDIFRSNQPKLSVVDGTQDLGAEPNGDLSHQSPFITYGQPSSFVQFTASRVFDDSKHGYEGSELFGGVRVGRTVQYLVDAGRVVDGLMSASQVYPVYLNGGPQNIEEAIIEPIPLAFRRLTNENWQEPLRGVFATLEGGNPSDQRRFGNSVAEQRIHRNPPRCVRYYLEFGAVYYIVTDDAGKVIEVVHCRPGAIADQSVVQKVEPWNEEGRETYLPTLTAPDNMLLAVESGSLHGTLGVDGSGAQGSNYFSHNYRMADSDIQSRDQKSAAAGFDVYGGNSAVYNVDSIAYSGYYKG